MSTSVCTGLNPFNFIRKHFLQICVRKVALHSDFNGLRSIESEMSINFLSLSLDDLLLRSASNTNTLIPQSILRQVHRLFQIEFSTECDLVLPLSVYSIHSVP
jgi:hypothetical protein